MLKLEIFLLKFRHTNILLDVNNYKFNKKKMNLNTESKELFRN